MSETIRYSPWAEPGAAAVTFLPKMTEHQEPGGVNWITRKSSPAAKSASSLQPRLRCAGHCADRHRNDDGRAWSAGIQDRGRQGGAVLGTALAIKMIAYVGVAPVVGGFA